MAKRRILAVSWPEPERDDAPGALQFADPSAARFPRATQEFNPPEYHSRNARPGGSGRVQSYTGDMVPWGDRYTSDVHANMNRKRGVSDDEDEA